MNDTNVDVIYNPYTKDGAREFLRDSATVGTCEMYVGPTLWY